MLAFACLFPCLAQADAPVVTRIRVDNGPVVSLAWSPDGSRIAYCGAPECRIVDVPGGHVDARIEGTAGVIAGLGQGVIGFAARGRFLVLPAEQGDSGALVSLWNAETGKPAGALDNDAAAPAAATASLFADAADGSDLAAASDGADEPAMVYALPSKKLLSAIKPPAGGDMAALALSADGKTLAAAQGNNSVAAFDVASGSLRGAVTYRLDWRVAPLAGLVYSPDGGFLAAGFGNAGDVKVAGPNDSMVSLGSPWPMAPVWVWRVHHGVPYGAPEKLCGAQTQGVRALLWRVGGGVVYAAGDGSVMACGMTGVGEKVWTPSSAGLTVIGLAPDGNRLAVAAGGEIDVLKLN